MAEKFTNAFKPWYVGSFKWEWWITFALGYVQYSVIFMVMVWRWAYCDYFNNSQQQKKYDGGNERPENIFSVLIYHWIRERNIRIWYTYSFCFSQICNFQTEKVWQACVWLSILVLISGAKYFNFFLWKYFYLRMLWHTMLC